MAMFYSYFLLTLFITYSFAANVRRATDYGSGNNAAPIVDNAGEEPIAKTDVKTQDDMSLGEMASNALSGAVQSGIANALLGNNGNSGNSDGQGQGQGYPQDQSVAGDNTGVIGDEDNGGAVGPTHQSKMRKIIKGAIQGAIAGGAAAAAGTAINNN